MLALANLLGRSEHMKHAFFLHTGYGKTKLILDKIMNTIPRPRVLLISTKNIIESAWSAEIEKWYPNKLTYGYITGGVKVKDRMKIINQQYDILGINTSMLDWFIKNTVSVKTKRYTKQGIKYQYNVEELIERFDLLVIDESSLFKNYRSERFKLLKQWAYKVKNVFILSATPTPKNIEDVWSQIYLLDGGKRLGKNITAFRERFAIPEVINGGITLYRYTQKATTEVLKLIQDITTSVPKPATPLFPEPTVVKTFIKPDPDTAKMLADFRKDYVLGDEIAFSKMQLINKVSQIASGNIYSKDTTIHLNDLKFNALQKLISKIKTPVLVTYNYVFDREKLLTLPGARLLKEDEDFVAWNNNEIPVGVLSPHSAAHGLNLQASECRDIIWFSPIWDTEKWIQTNARVCRRGQRYPVTIRVLLLRGSFDDYAFELCQDKFRVQYNNLNELKK